MVLPARVDDANASLALKLGAADAGPTGDAEGGKMGCGGGKASVVFRLTRWEFLAIVAITAIAATLRVWQWNESLWLDELHTAWSVADELKHVASRAAMGNQPPLYYWGVWLAVQFFGLTEPSLRLLSVLAGTALVPASYWCLRQWTNSPAAGLLAAAMVAVDRTCLFFSQEARPYACVQLVGLAHVAVFHRLLHRPNWRLQGLFCLLTVTLFYLHYTSLLLIGVEAILLIVLYSARVMPSCYRLGGFALNLLLASLCCAPRGVHLVQIAAQKDNWSLFIDQDQPWTRLFRILPAFTYATLPLSLLAVSWVIALSMRYCYDRFCRPPHELQKSGGRRLALGERFWLWLSIMVWWFAPLLAAWTLTRTDVARIFHVRYVIVAAIAPALAAALMLDCSPGKYWKLVLGIVMVCFLVWQGGYGYQLARDGRLLGDRVQDWRAACQLLSQRAKKGTSPVFVRSGLIEADSLRSNSDRQLADYCLMPVQGIYHPDIAANRLIPLPTTSSGHLSKPQIQCAANAGESWFLLGGSPAVTAQIEQEISRTLTAAELQGEVIERHPFGNVTVLRWKILAKPHDAG